MWTGGCRRSGRRGAADGTFRRGASDRERRWMRDPWPGSRRHSQVSMGSGVASSDSAASKTSSFVSPVAARR